MNEHDSEFDHHAHPVGPEIDDSANPTQTNPQDASSEPQPAASDSGADATGGDGGERPRSTAGREMLIQLQQMIDTVALQARPVMRDVAAKAAELAAVAAEKAGPAAHKAAEVTESVGERVAARSKEIAADLRRSPNAEGQEQPAADTSPEAEPQAESDGGESKQGY